MSTDASAHAAHGEVGHVVPYRILIATGTALLILTWVTVAVAQVHLGEANIFAALGIAAVKASLVALFFMHLRWDRPFNAIVFVTSLCFVALFMSFAMLDSSEYQDELLPGDAKAVVETISQQP